MPDLADDRTREALMEFASHVAPFGDDFVVLDEHIDEAVEAMRSIWPGELTKAARDA